MSREKARAASVEQAKVSAAMLAAADAVYAVLLARRSKVVEVALGPSDGIWRSWGVGLLGGYSVVQARIARRPDVAGLEQLALLRGLCAAGHVAALPVVAPRRRPVSVALLAMNVGVTALALRARRALSAVAR